jgi:hypothetical protein
LLIKRATAKVIIVALPLLNYRVALPQELAAKYGSLFLIELFLFVLLAFFFRVNQEYLTIRIELTKQVTSIRISQNTGIPLHITEYFIMKLQ